MKKEIINFSRDYLFEQYNNKDNPFLIITTKVDITNIYNNCSNYYATIAYFIALALNKIDNFKYRYEDNKIYYYDKINPNFTELFSDNNIGFFSCDLKENYIDYIENYKNIKKKFIDNHKSYPSSEQNEFWVSCTPWFNMSATTPPFDKNVTIPQFIWDKFSFEDDKVYINLMIMVHHGFVDGYHIGKFLSEFNNLIINIKNYI